MTDRAPDETCVFLLAPTAKDASASRALLEGAGIATHTCRDVEGLTTRIAGGAGAIVLPEEAILGGRGKGLAQSLASQPPWSSLPVIVLTAAGPDSAMKVRAILELGDVTLLKRPLEMVTFVNAVRAALRNRERQYQVRDHLAERKAAEEKLREQGERLRFALAAGRLGSWEVDLSTGVMECSDTCKANYGRPPGSPFTYQDLLEAIHPDEKDRVRAAVEEAKSAGKDYDVEYRTVWPDGTVHWVLVRGRVDRGAPLRMSGVSLDMTERKRAEQDQAQLAAIVESSDDAIVSMTLDGIILSWNAGAECLFGYTADEIVGQSITLIIPPERLDEERDILARLCRGERVDHFETVRVAKDGRRVDTSLTISPVRDAGGRVVGASKVARDITEKKRAEEALREADRKKDEFIALLAHELRNPLAPLRNGLQIMRLAGGDASAVAQARGMMERQLSHIVRLVDDLLDVSRIGRNKMELRKERVLLADAVNAAVETARPMIEAAGHNLQVWLPPGPVFLDADPTRLAQVFSNLLSNSAKYTEHGGRIRLHAERPAGEVVVTVSDNGIGIPAESLGNIFDMFSQVDRSIERSTGGLGIGLALVKGLVEMHGGTVTASSEGEGRGSAFTVRLPIAESKPAPRTDTPEGMRGPGRRVLVVDDNRDGAYSLAMMLRLLGDNVRTAHDGIEAVEAAGRFRPEVILMDVGMPRLNGLDATRRVREQPWGRAITIIALTGWGQDGDRERSREAGCDGHLVKPVNLPDLEKLLLELAGGDEPGASGSAG
jgi:PAS domain S-box-containing protein